MARESIYCPYEEPKTKQSDKSVVYPFGMMPFPFNRSRTIGAFSLPPSRLVGAFTPDTSTYGKLVPGGRKVSLSSAPLRPSELPCNDERLNLDLLDDGSPTFESGGDESWPIAPPSGVVTAAVPVAVFSKGFSCIPPAISVLRNSSIKRITSSRLMLPLSLPAFFFSSNIFLKSCSSLLLLAFSFNRLVMLGSLTFGAMTPCC